MLVMGMSSKKHQIPAIRFKGFTDAWEQRKLGELGQIMTGTTPPTNDVDNYSEDGMIWVTPTDIIKNVTTDTAKKLSKKGESAARVVPPGTILVTCIASIGKNTMVSTFVSFNQQINSLTPNSENDSYFLLTQSEIWSQKMKQIASSGTMQIVNKSEFSKLEVKVPSLEEQFKIGTFFKQIDDTIALHQRQLDNYKQLKKSMLQKIFNQEFRFKDEHENDFPEWENHKLGEVITEFNGKTEVNNQYPPLTSSRRGLFLQEDYFNRQVASKDTTGYNIVPYGYFTYRHMSDDLEFYFNINYLVPNGIVSTLYPVFTTKEIMNSNFLQIILNNGKEFKQFAILQKQGGSRTYMYLSKLKELILNIPCYLEQQEIVNFTLALDKKIELEEQKLKLLRKQKNWVMQQMFV